MYVIHSQRTLLLCLDMFILSPLMGGVSPQTTSTSSKLLSCIKDFPVDFPVVNKNNILTYLKVQKKKNVLQIVQKGRAFNTNTVRATSPIVEVKYQYSRS